MEDRDIRGQHQQLPCLYSVYDSFVFINDNMMISFNLLLQEYI